MPMYQSTFPITSNKEIYYYLPRYPGINGVQMAVDKPPGTSISSNHMSHESIQRNQLKLELFNVSSAIKGQILLYKVRTRFYCNY